MITSCASDTNLEIRERNLLVIDATGKVFEVGRDSCVLSSRRFKVSSAFNSKKKSL